jgi:RNA exonuclease 1
LIPSLDSSSFFYTVTVVEYSGIKPAMLKDVQTKIEDVQLHMLSLIQENDIIVGHSLENDLKALRLLHLNVVDTSMIFRGVNGRKYGEITSFFVDFFLVSLLTSVHHSRSTPSIQRFAEETNPK